MKRLIKAEALRLGFSLAGVTTPASPPHLAVFRDWLDAGRHGQMSYLATERARQARAEPNQLLPECQSILLLAVPYSAKIFDFAENFSRGKIASYAQGADYHDVLAGRLRILVSIIEDQVGAPVPNRWYTDTGPLLERDLAQRAGLGWIGKNTCLINPQHGSYFFLAEILLGLDLEPDDPFTADRCGACTRCIEACPTACILPDRTLDAHRCISYLTIELKGLIPPDLRALTGNWVFGCDICQQVCPWNHRFAPEEGDPAFAPRLDAPAPELLSDLSLTPAGFNRKFKGSPITRAKRRGYLRNVAVAIGNAYVGSGDLQAIAALNGALLNDPEPLVRGHAAWALGRIGGEAARQALNEAAQLEADSWVLAEIKHALFLMFVEH